MWVLECRKEPRHSHVILCAEEAYDIFFIGECFASSCHETVPEKVTCDILKSCILKLPVHLIMPETTCRHHRHCWCINIVIFKIALFVWKCSEDFFFPLYFAFKGASSITSARQRQLLLIHRWKQTHQTCWCWADVDVTVSSPVFLFHSFILSFFGLFWHFLIILCVCVCVCLQEVWACWCELLSYLEQENAFLDQLEQKLDETDNLQGGAEELQEALDVSRGCWLEGRMLKGLCVLCVLFLLSVK